MPLLARIFHTLALVAQSCTLLYRLPATRLRQNSALRLSRRAGANRHLVMLVLIAAAGLLEGAALAQPALTPEYKIKAGFLFNFLKYVEFPPNALPQADYTIGILGEDPFGLALDKGLSGKKVNDRGVIVKRFKEIAEIQNCQILFVSRSEKGRLAEIFSALKGKGVLTVGETEQFAQKGGIINFAVDNNQVENEINLPAAKREGLQISAQLLAISKLVK